MVLKPIISKFHIVCVCKSVDSYLNVFVNYKSLHKQRAKAMKY